MQIRRPTRSEVPELLEIERRSSHRFADVPGLTGWVDEVTPIELVEAAVDARLSWVAEAEAEGTGARPLVGWCFASVIDDALFVEQIDVLPDHGRRGIGRALIDAVEEEACARGLSALTLTTDAHVLWNRPWYEKIGFRVLSADEQSPGLAAAMAHEGERGFDLSRRVAMRRDVSA